MTDRRPMACRAFYPGDCERALEEFLGVRSSPADCPASLHAAVVPHAGWRYSGAVAADALATLAERSSPSTILLFGAYHRPVTSRSVVDSSAAWETPLGDLAVDRELAARIAKDLDDLVEENRAPHAAEHSLEVEAPMIRHLFPGAAIVPVLVLPQADPARLGAEVARLIDRERTDAVAVASTDLTHYGDRFHFAPVGYGARAHRWMRANDAQILALVRRLDAEAIPAEAESHCNACGPGALAAAVAFARARRARRGIVLARTDSHEVTGQGQPFTSAVGYAGAVLG